MISKELLSEVFDINCSKIELPIKGNQVGFETDNKSFTHLINIHELAHKCKEWATKQKEVIYIDTAEGIKANITEVKVCTASSIFTKEYEFSILKPEHIFEYCQWILENQVKGK